MFGPSTVLTDDNPTDQLARHYAMSLADTHDLDGFQIPTSDVLGTLRSRCITTRAAHACQLADLGRIRWDERFLCSTAPSTNPKF